MFRLYCARAHRFNQFIHDLWKKGKIRERRVEQGVRITLLNKCMQVYTNISEGLTHAKVFMSIQIKLKVYVGVGRNSHRV